VILIFLVEIFNSINDSDLIKLKVKTAPMWYPVSIVYSSERILPQNAQTLMSYIKSHLPEKCFRNDYEAMINS
jgi:hypothetical protein